MEGEHSREDLQEALGLTDRKHFRRLFLNPALSAGLIERTIPDKPTNQNQKYRITDLGKRARDNLNHQP